MKLIRFLLAVLTAFVFTARAWAQTEEAYAWVDGTTLRICYDTQRNAHTGTKYSIPWTGEYPGWWEKKGVITGAVFEQSFARYQGLTNASNMFSGFESLVSIDASHFNTSNVTNMAGMFSGCKQLTSLNLGSFNTGNVEDMSHMFDQCINLVTIYVSSLWGTANVTSSDDMFAGCSKLRGGLGTLWRNSYPADKTYARIDGDSNLPGYLTGVVYIGEETFPDDTFRSWVLQQSYGQDCILTTSEIASVTSINVNGLGIYDLKGIESFTAIATLDCANNNLESLDLSGNTALKTIDCYNNRLNVPAMEAFVQSLPKASGTLGILTVIDNSTNSNEGNSMTTAQATAARSKKWNVKCTQGEFEARVVIDEGSFPDAKFRAWIIQQSYGQDYLLTASEMDGIKSLYVNNKQIADLTGIENFTKLIILNCSQNQLTTLDVTRLTSLTQLSCTQNKLEALDLSQNTKLAILNCSQNQLKQLDLSSNNNLNTVYCYSNMLKPIHIKDLFDLHLPDQSDAEWESTLRILDCDDANEGNDLTNVDITLATNKGWKVLNRINNKWVEQTSKVADSDLMITKVRFPDDNFRTWLLAQSFGVDGRLTESEISTVKEIDVTRKDIADLRGIEVFTALEILKCSQNALTRENVEYLVNALPYKWLNGGLLIAITSAVAGIMQMDMLGDVLGGLLQAFGIENAPAMVYEMILDKKSLKLDIYDNTLQNEGNVVTHEAQQIALSRGWVMREFDESENKWKTIDCCVEINEENFPDPNFRNWVLTQPYGQDGKLYDSEANRIYSIDVHGENIKSLKGIEHFSALETLYCQRNQIEGDDMVDLMFNLPTDTKMQIIRDVIMQSEKYVNGSFDRNLYVYSGNNENEKNVCDKFCIRLAKQRGWKVFALNGTSWEEYAGCENGASGMKGDMNNDNKVTIADAVLIVDEILNK